MVLSLSITSVLESKTEQESPWNPLQENYLAWQMISVTPSSQLTVIPLAITVLKHHETWDSASGWQLPSAVHSFHSLELCHSHDAPLSDWWLFQEIMSLKQFCGLFPLRPRSAWSSCLVKKLKTFFSLLTSSPIYFVSEDPLESSGLEETHCSSLSPQPYLL